MAKVLTESLQEYRKLNPRVNETVQNVVFNEEDLNEGLNDKQKAAVKDLAAKEVLDDEDFQNYGKLISAIVKSFQLGQKGTGQGDLALKLRKKLLQDPVKYKKHILPFVKVFAVSLEQGSKARLFSWDSNKNKFIPRLGNLAKAKLGSELGA